MSQSSGLLTDDGHALIAAKIAAEQTLAISYFVYANVAGLDPEQDPATYSQVIPTADIVYTAPVTRAGSIDDDTVIYSSVLDSTVGDFEFNWIGLFDADDTLVMIKQTYPQQKTGNAFGGGNNLTRNFALKFVGAATVTAITIPAESWQFDLTENYLVVFITENMTAKPLRKHRFMLPAELQLTTAPDGTTITVGVDFAVDLSSGVCKLIAPATETITLPDANYNDVDITTIGVDFTLTRYNGAWRA